MAENKPNKKKEIKPQANNKSGIPKFPNWVFLVIIISLIFIQFIFLQNQTSN